MRRLKQKEVIKICKAVISVEGTAYLAVFRDGQPHRLGREIYEAALRGQSITRTAAKHVIVAAVPRLLSRMNLGRLAYLVKKHKYSEELIRKGFRRGSDPDADDQFIVSITDYGDQAEHQYDLREDGVYWRPLIGCWPESAQNSGEFKKLGYVMLERLKRKKDLSSFRGEQT